MASCTRATCLLLASSLWLCHVALVQLPGAAAATAATATAAAAARPAALPGKGTATAVPKTNAATNPRKPVAAVKKPVAAQKPKLPPLAVTCKTNRITGWSVPWIVWNCRIKSKPGQSPFCLKLSCANVNTGGCPLAGQGPTGTIPPVACGWGLVSNGDGTCVTQFPIFPMSDTGYGFTIDSRLPLSVRPLKYFAATGGTCVNQ